MSSFARQFGLWMLVGLVLGAAFETAMAITVLGGVVIGFGVSYVVRRKEEK